MRSKYAIVSPAYALCKSAGYPGPRFPFVRRSSKTLYEADSAEAEGSSGRSSARLIAALEALTRSEEGMGLAELSLAVGAPKSSLLGILRSLVRVGYLAHAHGLYRLGPRSFRLGADMLAVGRFSQLVRPGVPGLYTPN